MHEQKRTVTEQEAESPVLSEQDQKSVHILASIQDCYDFRCKNGKVCFYDLNQKGSRALKEEFSVEDFFKAVDYYYENRVSEIAVDHAMQKKDGVVNVYSPHHPSNPDDRTVVVSIKNYMVPQILEFAYLIARDMQKEGKE
jgi:hypothetical protein